MKRIIILLLVLLSLTVSAAPLMESGGTITASVGGGSSGSSGATGGGGGGHRDTGVNTSSSTALSCSGFVYGYPVGTHTCRVYNNCSVPANLQVVSKCPYDEKLDYGYVCSDDSCSAPVVEEKVVEKVVEVPVNNTVEVVKEVSVERIPWWSIFGFAIAFVAIILAFVFYRRGRKEEVKEVQSAEEYKQHLDEKIKKVKEEAHTEAQKRFEKW